MSIGKPTVDEAIRAIVQSTTSEWQTCLPGRIETYDAGAGVCSVLPLVKRKGKASEATSRPVLTGVPVMWPGSGGAQLRWPLAAGDECVIMFASADTSGWRRSGGEADPASERRFALSDAVVLPLGRQGGTPDVIIEVQAGGKLRIANGSVELVDALLQVLNAVFTGKVTGVGAVLDTAGALLPLKTALETMKV
jgi:hypothetical protein